MNEELNKKLAEWAGLIVILPDEGATDGWDMREDTHLGYHSIGWIDFTQSLDACFKWLVPKYLAEVSQLPMGFSSIMAIHAHLFAEWLKIMNEKIEPALALCLAIEKLVDSEAKWRR